MLTIVRPIWGFGDFVACPRFDLRLGATRISAILGCALMPIIAWPNPMMARAACPLSCLYVNNSRGNCSDSTSRTFSAYQYQAGYDLFAGTAFNHLDAPSPTNVGLATNDDFTVGGIPDGTPLSIDALFPVSGRLWAGGNSAFASARLTAGSNSDVLFASTSSSANVRQTLRVTIACVAGQPFLINVQLATSADLFTHPGVFVQSWLDGFLVFDGLPPGGFITSCQGYHFEAPVAVQNETWGAVKIRYR